MLGWIPSHRCRLKVGRIALMLCVASACLFCSCVGHRHPWIIDRAIIMPEGCFLHATGIAVFPKLVATSWKLSFFRTVKGLPLGSWGKRPDGVAEQGGSDGFTSCEWIPQVEVLTCLPTQRSTMLAALVSSAGDSSPWKNKNDTIRICQS